MNKYSFLNSLLYKPWAISEDYAFNAGALIQTILNPNLETIQGEEPEANIPTKIIVAGASSGFAEKLAEAQAQETNIQIIPIRGELMKNDQFCGPVGTKTIGDRIKQADSDKMVDAIFLIFDTPGGTVDGTATLANIIKTTEKPIVSFIDGMCASAGMWIASAADKVIASDKMDRVGSIGVMTSFTDMQPYWEALGIKFHEIYSSLSKDKNRMYSEMKKGEYDNYIKNVLDPLAEEFRSTIKTNRPASGAEHFTGKDFFAKDVTGSLIDQIANFDEALRITAEMVSNQSNSNSKTKAINMKKLEQLSAVLGVDGLESTEDGIFLSETQLDAVEENLAEHAAQLSAVNAEKDLAIATASEKVQESADKDLTIQQMEQTIAALKNQPAEKAAVVVTDTNDVVKDTDVNVSKTSDDFITRLQKVGEAYL